jgi:hypothetical protein
MRKIIISFLFLIILIIPTYAVKTDIIPQSNPVKYCNNTYELEVLYINEGRVTFRLNNETTPLLEERGLYTFNEGSTIHVIEILEEEALEGPDMVYFNFFPDKKCIEAKPIKIEELKNITEKINISENITEVIEDMVEIPKIAENITEEIVPQKEKISLIQKIINWIINLFK